MLVKPSAYQYAPAGIFPFILGVCAGYPDSLVGNPVVTPHVIFQIVLIILKTDSQVRRHEKAFLELIYILRTADPGQVRSLTVGIRVLLRAIVAVSVDMLDGSEYIEPVFLVLREPVELKTSGVDAVLCLLGNHHLMRRKVKIVATSSELLKMVIFSGYLRIQAGLDISSEPGCLA